MTSRLERKSLCRTAFALDPHLPSPPAWPSGPLLSAPADPQATPRLPPPHSRPDRQVPLWSLPPCCPVPSPATAPASPTHWASAAGRHLPRQHLDSRPLSPDPAGESPSGPYRPAAQQPDRLLRWPARRIGRARRAISVLGRRLDSGCLKADPTGESRSGGKRPSRR